jgi:hypothetical protein
MSISPANAATSIIAMKADAARQTFATAMVKQQAKSDASIVDLVTQALDTAKASAPPGQGNLVDISA